MTLKIFDVNGRAVRTFSNPQLGPGPHTIVWDGRDNHNRLLSPGVYLSRLRAGGGTFDQRMIRVR